MGCSWHSSANQFRRMWLSTSCKLHRICKTIWVIDDTLNVCLYLDCISFSCFPFSFSHIGEPFPCFYSRAYPEMVITRYSWEDNLKHLILSLIIPNVLFAISIGVLSYWYCPCCDKACRKTRVYAEKFPTKEEWVPLFCIYHCDKLFFSM